ncbi:hypothetical protein [Kocuria sp. CH-021]|uniref:hypothetical protein n=1 Tax=Kocuria sp. CH-021 TaxID=3406735 RepID=UPI003C7289FD
MTSHISPTAATAREAARSTDGKFGTQPLAEADIDLTPIGPAPVDPALSAPPMTFRRGARDSTHQEYIVTGAGPGVRRLTTVRDEHGDFIQVEHEFDLDSVTDRCLGADHPDPFAWQRARQKDIAEIVEAHDPGFGQRLSYFHGDTIEAESVDPSVDNGGVNAALTAAAARAAAIPVEDIVVEGLKARSAADTAAGRELAGEHAGALTDAQADGMRGAVMVEDVRVLVDPARYAEATTSTWRLPAPRRCGPTSRTTPRIATSTARSSSRSASAAPANPRLTGAEQSWHRVTSVRALLNV